MGATTTLMGWADPHIVNPKVDQPLSSQGANASSGARENCKDERNLIWKANFLRESSPADALSVLEACKEQLGPEALALYKKLVPEVESQKKKRMAREAAAQAQSEKVLAENLKLRKAERRLHGVRLGMSQQEVLDSNWGRPNQVNSTTTKHGVHEQWVYGQGNYLYFENGVLTAIQN